MTWNAGDNPGFVVATFHRNRRPETVSYCSLAGESQIVIAYISFTVLFVSAMLLAKLPIVRCSRRWFNTHSCIVTYILMVFFLYNWVIFHRLEMLGRIKSYCSIFFWQITRVFSEKSIRVFLPMMQLIDTRRSHFYIRYVSESWFKVLCYIILADCNIFITQKYRKKKKWRSAYWGKILLYEGIQPSGTANTLGISCFIFNASCISEAPLKAIAPRFGGNVPWRLCVEGCTGTRVVIEVAGAGGIIAGWREGWWEVSQVNRGLSL